MADQDVGQEKRCREVIYSEEYLDILIDDKTRIPYVSRFVEIGCVQDLDERQAIIHVKLPEDELSFILGFGYRMVPKCYGLMDISNVEDIGVLQLRRRPYIDLYGKNVIIAVIDTGIDYLHPVFRNADNTSRILGIWDQSIESGPTPSFLDYGTYYNNEDINRAISSDKPYEIVPSVDESGHGTFMAGIAAGNEDMEHDFTGIAPQAGIVVVKLKQAKENLKHYYGIRKDTICFQESDILRALNYIFWEAEKYKRPVIIYYGFGTNQGDHNGNSFLGGNLSRIGFLSGVGNVIGGGNETNQRHHFFGTIKETEEYQEVEIEVGENERGFALELWANMSLFYSIGIISPEGEFSHRIPARLGKNEKIDFLFESTVIYVRYELIEVGSGDELISFNFQSPTSGIWKIRVYNDNDRRFGGEYHMWLPIREFTSNPIFFINSNPYTTICEPGNAVRVLTIAAYDHKNDSIYANSSRGYTRSDIVKPIVTAPGVNIYGPLPGGGFGVRTGTSVAAAHGAGVCALLMEWGLIENNVRRMNTIDLERFLIRGARRDNRVYPNREWGYGVINIVETFESLRTTI